MNDAVPPQRPLGPATAAGETGKVRVSAGELRAGARTPAPLPAAARNQK